MPRKYKPGNFTPSDMNQEQLQSELASIGNIGLSISGGEVTCFIFDNTTNEAIDIIFAAHDKNVITAKQTRETLSVLTKSEIKAYLRSQLVNASPNLATIKSTIESAIGSNAQATQAISNIASLYGYDDTTASGYVRCALLAVPILVD